MPRLRLSKNPLSVFSSGAGFAMGTAAAPALRPILQDEINRVWALHPVRPLDPEQAALAEIVAGWTAGRVRDEANKSGTSDGLADVMRAMAGTAPGVAQLLALRNRDRITDDTVRRGLRQLEIRAEWHDEILALRFGVLDANTAAQLVARGLMDDGTGRNLANDTGVSAGNFDRMVAAASQAPSTGQVLEWGNRTGQSTNAIAAALEDTGLRSEWRSRVAALRRYLIPPSDVLRLAVHEVYDPAKRSALDLDAEFPPEFAAKAALLGISEEDARDLWAGHWGLPSYSQASEMLFRGEISQAQFANLLAALDYAPTWRGKLEAIARRIPTVTDFQRLVRRGIYGGDERQEFQYDAEYPAAFTQKMALHGMSEQDAKDLWAGGWRMPSATQLYKMLWRDEINDNQLGKGLKALDYPIFWRDRLANIARPTLGRIDIRRSYAAGIITRQKALELYGKLGYTPEDAAIMVRLATPTSATTTKDLTLSQLASEFERGMITADEFAAELRDLGYDADEIAALRSLSDRKRVDRAREQKIATIRTAYVGHRLREAEARAALAASGIPATAVDDVFTEWKDARAANVRVLSPTNLKSLYKAAKITIDEAREQLVFRGYAPAAADQLISTWD